MGYGDKWRMWIKGCLQSAGLSVLINGSPTAEFGMEKGMRQGDPLSPFLFIIAMEGLNIAVKAACQKDLFHGIKIPHSEISISHLFYADDAIFVGEWSQSNIKNLARGIKMFSGGVWVEGQLQQVYGFWCWS
ncbi:uncharacterized mitochondrial protein AtMg01250-like [Lactuca sativa]|uniref:uncharacterized mitochondrial protein AtMg01250-like n=1 Tax=Lactuca sativa TaxID=4236 RepID=UPI000CD8CE23|nr:uncharacterized mitochondrial protein AtMg01250-like [Lactuca sativa]